jgi:hypothetical protein
MQWGQGVVVVVVVLLRISRERHNKRHNVYFQQVFSNTISVIGLIIKQFITHVVIVQNW